MATIIHLCYSHFIKLMAKKNKKDKKIFIKKEQSKTAGDLVYTLSQICKNALL